MPKNLYYYAYAHFICISDFYYFKVILILSTFLSYQFDDVFILIPSLLYANSYEISLSPSVGICSFKNHLAKLKHGIDNGAETPSGEYRGSNFRRGCGANGIKV